MLPLFARHNEDEFIIVVLVVAGVVLFVWLTIWSLFLMVLSTALSRCQPHNRTMEPGMVWLNLIPLFNFVWRFITMGHVASSLCNEYRDRGWHYSGEDYGRGMGTAAGALGIAGYIPYCGALFSLAWLICGIIYWVKIAGYSGRLASRAYAPADDYDDYDDDYDDDDEYDDDRDRRRRR